MEERQILFTGPMVRAILEGRKTQTRRVIKPLRGCFIFNDDGMRQWDRWAERWRPCPYGVPGDRLWVREAHILDPPIDGTWEHGPDSYYHIEDIPQRYRTPRHVIYRADQTPGDGWKWRPSIHMPRWASRITLEITDVRVERVQDISEADARAEGCVPAFWSRHPGLAAPDNWTHRADFAYLWDSINAKRGFGWDVNPWVWVVEFRACE